MFKCDAWIPTNQVFMVGSQINNKCTFNSADLSLYHELLLRKSSADLALTTVLNLEDQMPHNK